MKPDLFPETLLVNINAGHTQTTSMKLAEYFHKRHDHVMRDIEQLLADLTVIPFNAPNFGDISGLNFELTEYLDSRKRVQKMYLLTYADFSLVTMGFTGIKALRWKVDFITAFNQMEAQLQSHIKREASALHQLRPLLAPVVTATEQGLRRAVMHEKVKATLLAEGVNLSAWCRDHNLKYEIVRDVLRGKLKGNRGESHRAAILLGLKPNPVTHRFTP
jgi:gp16 family phage-associated protein